MLKNFPQKLMVIAFSLYTDWFSLGKVSEERSAFRQRGKPVVYFPCSSAVLCSCALLCLYRRASFRKCMGLFLGSLSFQLFSSLFLKVWPVDRSTKISWQLIWKVKGHLLPSQSAINKIRSPGDFYERESLRSIGLPHAFEILITITLFQVLISSWSRCPLYSSWFHLGKIENFVIMEVSS